MHCLLTQGKLHDPSVLHYIVPRRPSFTVYHTAVRAAPHYAHPLTTTHRASCPTHRSTSLALLKPTQRVAVRVTLPQPRAMPRQLTVGLHHSAHIANLLQPSAQTLFHPVHHRHHRQLVVLHSTLICTIRGRRDVSLHRPSSHTLTAVVADALARVQERGL